MPDGLESVLLLALWHRGPIGAEGALRRSPRRRAILVTAPKTVVGCHGCSLDVAEAILAENRFQVSTNTYDWLGEGADFWEFAPDRALEWARRKCETTCGERVRVVYRN